MPVQQQGMPPPSRVERFMAIVRWRMVLAVALLAVWAWWPRLVHSKEVAHAHGAAQLYVCPMHPQIVADQPGKCPICQMDLVRFERKNQPEEVDPDTPKGTQPLQLTLDRVQAIGVRTAVALSQPVSPTLAVTGLVQASETGRSEVHVRAPSFVEKVLVEETGVFVHKGEALALIYSPEIIAMQGEVLAAGQWSDKTARAAVKQRLALYGLTDGEMDALFREGRPRRLLTLRAPQDGVVATRAAVPGGYAMPDVALYTLQDLSTLWLEVAIPQAQLPQLRPGLVAMAQWEGLAQAVPAVLDRVLPQIDAERRTGRVRFLLQSPPKTLLPGAWLQVALPTEPAHDAILVPRDAVIDTGHEQYVFRVADGGWYLPTKVEVGALYGEQLEIRTGLSAGDKVVATGGFLIDAESRVQASVRALSESTTPARGGQP